MAGFNRTRDGRDCFCPPLLEGLEPRLLLTTMALGGASLTNLVYMGSQGQLVRVTLSNSVTGVGEVEVMRWDGNDVADMPPLPSLPAQPVPTDPFAVYIADADEYTILTFSTIRLEYDVNTPVPVMNEPSLWAASPTAHLGGGLFAPAGSGAVLIGAIPTPTTDEPDLHSAVDVTGIWVTDASPLGCYPGGELHAGFMSAGPMGEVVAYGVDLGLGRSVSALAGDSLGGFYAVDNLTHTLMQALYDPLTVPPSTTSTSQGQVVDAVEPSFRYDNIFALDFDSTDTLYGVATITDTVPGAPTPPTGTWLVTIDIATAQATRVVELSGATNISTIAFDDADALYGVDADSNSLVSIDMATGNVTTIAPITHVNWAPMPDIKGLAFHQVPDPAVPPGPPITVLDGIGGSELFRIDLASAVATPQGEVGFVDAPALAHTDAYPDHFWTVTFYDHAYRLVEVDPFEPPMDFSRLLVAGTVAGSLDITGSIEVVQVGFVWCKVNVRHDINSLLVQTDAGGVVNDDGDLVTPDNSVVYVGGTLHEMDVYGTLYTSIDVRGGPNIPLPWGDMADLNALSILEMEPVKPDGSPGQYVPWVESGELKTVNNDTVEQAQFLFNESGNLIVQGEMSGDTGAGDRLDYYSISLMAGQTVRIDGYEVDTTFGVMQFGSLLGLAFYDSDMNYAGSVGWETVEDHGINSKGFIGEALVFTAPRAGVYHLVVGRTVHPVIVPGGDETDPITRGYTLSISGGVPAALGAVHVNTSYSPAFGGLDVLGNQDLAVSGGSLGAVQVHGIPRDVDVHVFGDNDLVAFRADQIGRDGDDLYPCGIVSHGSIGLVESSTGDLNAHIIAGADEGLFDNDAHIDNVISANHLFSTGGYVSPVNPGVTLMGLWATGSIGSVFTAGGVAGSVDFQINGDNVGPTAYLDQIDVRGDWGGLADSETPGVPRIYHGANADVRFVHVTGDMHEGSVHLLEPTRFDDGTPSVTDDDGGGQIRIRPDVLVDVNGDPILVPDPADPAGRRMMTVPTPYSFSVIPVYDSPLTRGKVGGVLANLTMDGPGSVNLVKPGDEADIGRLELTGPGDFRLGGTGALGVYHVQATDVNSFVNSTRGDLVSGNFTTSVDIISLGGSLGRMIGTMGQWIWGLEPAPDDSEMGWFRRQINGILVNGDITTSLRVDGWLGDVLVTGRAENIRVNVDNLTPPDDFHGVIGVVHVGSLNQINVGDGLADDGPGDRAIAAILSDAEIERVLIEGPGRVLNGTVVADAYINEVIGRDGAINTAIVATTDLDIYKPYKGSRFHTGWVGRVEFSGEGAMIHGAEVYAQYIVKIATSADSDGMWFSYFSGLLAPVNGLAIGRVLAGGPGMYECAVVGDGGSLGVIRGVGAAADMAYNYIDSSDSLVEFSGRDIFDNNLNVPGKVGLMKADRDMFGNIDIDVGAIDQLTTGRHFAGNYFTIAAELKNATIGGRFSDSTLDFQGPFAKLGKLYAEEDISGQILSAGSIGSVISRTGTISADIATTANYTSGDVGLISTFGGYTGALDVAGNLGKFVSYSALGKDPSTIVDYVPKRFNVAGDLGYLGVKALKGGPPVHLYTTLYIGGDAGSVDVDGSMYADLIINGNLGRLTLDGDMGGIFNLPTATVVGDLTVLGKMGRFSMPGGSSIVGDMTIGGSINRITLKDKAGLPGAGNIEGDITSLYGSIEGISLTNGLLSGSLTAARGIGRISLRGSLADPANITGNIVAQGGGIASIDVRGGDLDADVSALAGGIGKLSVRDGDIVAGHTIYTVGSIGLLAVHNGNLDADVTAGAGLGKLDLKGSNLTGDVTIGTDVSSIKVAGIVNGSTIWVGGLLKSFSAGSVINAVVSSLYGMDKVNVAGNVSNSQIIGGYNAGTGALHSARIKSIKVGGNWNNSLVALGVDPVDGDFTTLGDNLPAPGLSGLDKMTLGGTVGVGGAGSLIIADTWTGDTPAGIPTETVDISPPLAGPTYFFGQGTTTIGGVEITLKGDGEGSFDPTTNELVLSHTTGKTKLSVYNPGAHRDITLVAGDDDSLSSLDVRGNLALGDTDFDGRISKFSVAGVVNGASWQLPGGVDKMSTGGAANADIVLGDLGTWKMLGGFLAGSLTADAITNSMSVAGNLGAAVTTVAGTIKRLDVSGTVSGDVTAHNGLGRFTAGSVSGDVLVEGGDLGQMRVNGDLAGSVNVQAGYLGKIDIRGGSFGSPLEDQAIRALMGIGQYSLSGGVSGGLISTDGAIKRIKVTSTMSTRVRAGGGIGSVNVDVLTDALLSSGGTIGKVTIRRDMVRSDISAGFDASDAGYDPAAGGEAANVRFDARTLPATWRTVGNMDELSGGDVVSVKVGGDMIASSISAGVGPGADGSFGTDDDNVRGSGYIRRVKLGGYAVGSADPTEHYGIYAASGTPKVSGSGLFYPVGNFDVGTLATSSGSPRVVDVQVYGNRIEVFFDHDLDFSTINTARINAAQPTTFDLVVSRNGVFGPGEADDVSISDDVDNLVTYDDAAHSVTLTLVGNTWQMLNLGTHFRLSIDASVVADRRWNLLDGEYDFAFPSGDGLAGGDFVYNFVFGDAGDTDATATDLNNVMALNQIYQINGEIGDNVGPPASDVDVYQISVKEGDIFYWYSPQQRGPLAAGTITVSLTDTGGLLSSISSAGDRALADGDVFVNVSGSPGPYSLYLLRFNDDNSNFNFDDLTQQATALAWIGNIAEPDIEDQEILAPDDVDLYLLGALPAYTEITVTLETMLIGSPLAPKMAVFNSTGDLVGNIMFSDYGEGVDIVGMVPVVTLAGTVLTPADDTYYVAVAGLGFDPAYDPDFNRNHMLFDMGKYRLTVMQEAAAAPVYPKQMVYLNFTGGVADFLTEPFPYIPEAAIPLYQEPLSAALFGFEAGQTQALLNVIVDRVETIYAGFANIEFTAVKPLTGSYSTVFVGGTVFPGLLGIAEKIDSYNSDLTDDAVAFGGSFAFSYWGGAGWYTIDDIGRGLGNLVAHELGHILGLNHVQVTTDNWVMAYGSLMAPTVFTSHAPLFTNEFLIGYQNSIESLAPVA